MDLPRLLLLTDRSQLRLGRSLLRTVGECVEAGATHVVLRELDEPAEARAALAAAFVEAGATVIAARTWVPGAAGLHLPACPSSDRTGRVGRSAVAAVLPRHSVHDWSVVGRSCHSRAEVEQAAAEGASWATLSPYAETPSKPGYGPPLPPTAYAGHPIPVFALGGITPANTREARDHGAYGVAVMGAVMRDENPAAVVRALLEAAR